MVGSPPPKGRISLDVVDWARGAKRLIDNKTDEGAPEMANAPRRTDPRKRPLRRGSWYLVPSFTGRADGTPIMVVPRGLNGLLDPL